MECIYDGPVIRYRCAVCNGLMYVPFGPVLNCLFCSDECERKFWRRGPFTDKKSLEELKKLHRKLERKRSSDAADAIAQALWYVSGDGRMFARRARHDG